MDGAPFVLVPGSRPQASALAILQARRGTAVTNLRHELVTISEDARRLLPLLDGVRTRREIASIGWPGEPEPNAAANLERSLANLARQALLVS
jgi:hypothetical protein